MLAPLNVLGTPIKSCSQDPMTGWFRDGCCNTSDTDAGSHTVCCRLTDEFLQILNSIISKSKSFTFIYSCKIIVNF